MRVLSEIEKVRQRIDRGMEFHDKMKQDGIERAHEAGGPTSPFACGLCSGRGSIPTDNMDASYDCPECDGSGI